MPVSVNDRLRPVTSRQNAALKGLRRAFARGEATADGFCAIETVRLIEEAIRSGLKFKTVFFSQTAQTLAARLLPQIGSHVETLVLPDEVFASSVSTENSQGVAALVKLKESSLPAVLAIPQPLLVVAVGVQDPGNLGTVIRSAEAFGAHALLLAEGTVSPFNAKVVRASAGSLFRLSVIPVKLGPLLPQLRERAIRLVATSAHRGVPLPAATLAGGVALFVGSEGAGLPRDLLSKMEETVVIPHSPRVESLNAGVAASIVLYEISRQRKAI
jgi:TrmH family RNA methyltransferase